MAAVVQINRLTSTGPTLTDITSINSRAATDDTHSTAGTTNPIKIPAAGVKRSYWVSTRLNVISGLVGTIDNLRWYSAGTPDTGVTVNGQTATAYVQATGVVGDSGDVLNTANHTSLAAATVDITTHTAGSPKAVAGTITATTGVFGDQFVYQFEVGSTASPGAATALTFTWQYDET